MAYNNLCYLGIDTGNSRKSLPKIQVADHSAIGDNDQLFERPSSCPSALDYPHKKSSFSAYRSFRSSHRRHLSLRHHRNNNAGHERKRQKSPKIFTIQNTLGFNGDPLHDADIKSNLSIALQREESTTLPATVPSADGSEEKLFSRQLIIFMLALLCSTNLCLAMGASLIAPFFPEEAIRKGGTATLAGVVMSSFDAVRFFLAPVVGQYINAIGARFMLISGPFIVAWCSVLFGVLGMAPPGKWFFLLGIATRMVAGCGAIAYSVTSVSIRPVLFSGNVSFAYGALRASSTLGVIVGPAIGGILYAAGGYGLPFWMLGALSLSLTAIQAFVTPDLSEVDDKKKRNYNGSVKIPTTPASVDRNIIQLRESNTDSNKNDAVVDPPPLPLYKTPTVYAFAKNIHILLCFIMNASIGYVVMFYSANIALHILPLVYNDVSRVGYIILISGIAEVIVAPLAGWLLDRGLSAELSITVSYTLCALGLLLIGPSPLLPFLSKSLYLVIFGTFIYGCGIGFGFSAPYKLATHHAVASGYAANQQTYGVLAGCMVTFYTFGAFLGPITGGLLHDSVGFPWAATIVVAYLVVMIIISSIRSCWYCRRQSKPVV